MKDVKTVKETKKALANEIIEILNASRIKPSRELQKVFTDSVKSNLDLQKSNPRYEDRIETLKAFLVETVTFKREIVIAFNRHEYELLKNETNQIETANNFLNEYFQIAQKAPKQSYKVITTLEELTTYYEEHTTIETFIPLELKRLIPKLHTQKDDVLNVQYFKLK